MTSWVVKYLGYTRSHLPAMVVLITTIVLGAVFAVLQPWPMKLLIDYTLGAEPFPEDWNWVLLLPRAESAVGQVVWLSGFTVIIYVAGFLVRYAARYAETAMGHQMIYELGGDVFDHLLRLSPRYHSANATGDLVRRVTIDVAAVRDLVLNVATPLLTSLLTLMAMFAVMWSLNATLALLALATAVPLTLMIKVFSEPMARLSHEQQEAEGNLMAIAEQTLSTIPIVQAYRREPLEDNRFRDASGKSARAYLRSVLSQLHFKTGVDGVTALGSAAVMAVGSFYVLSDHLTIGELLVLLSYLAAVYAPLQTLAYLSSGYASATGMARRVSEIMDATDRVPDAPATAARVDSTMRVTGEVVMQRVTFGYREAVPVVNHVSLHASPGQTLALVGPSGTGKSTLLSLIPRLYDPWTGRVMVDGRDIRSVPIDYLRLQISVVLQEPFLLPISIAENIAYGRPSATRREIEAAALRSGAHEFVARLPHGYDTLVGERGATLSGGEKQRISFARALLKNAPILILDEPTSSVDSRTEEIMVAGLTELMKNRTTFVIAHRLSTVRMANQILVMEHGRILESGTHKELVAQAGLYREFYLKQARAKPSISI
ncbi:MAG: ABC transporter ATP-binding protein/permease [Rhodothermia bacterium]|nr:ABC transporter ATP-binding protein/permease [Rhodothermia bacterium]